MLTATAATEDRSAKSSGQRCRPAFAHAVRYMSTTFQYATLQSTTGAPPACVAIAAAVAAATSASPPRAEYAE
eukprot:scaffold27837_cov133-Isochrysis_galbana.AAC.3